MTSPQGTGVLRLDIVAGLVAAAVEAMFSAHTWPRRGNDRIQEVMRTQRDVYGRDALKSGILIPIL